MSRPLRAFIFLAAFLLGVGFAAHPAEAHTHHHHAHKKHAIHARAGSSVTRRVKTAQQHLISLGYMSGKADGVLGTKTKIALQHFQRDHLLPISGKLTTATYNALVEMDMEKGPAIPGSTAADAAPAQLTPAPQQPDFYASHPDYYGHVNQQFSDPMQMSSTTAGDQSHPLTRTTTLPNRFTKIDVAENVQGTFKSYAVTVNGQPMLHSEDQPAVIGISRTFDLGNEDVIVFSTYRSFDPLCSYKTYLLASSAAGGTNVQEVNNCTRGYQASVKNGSLFITFPEADDQRAVGSIWRYEKGNLQKL